MPWTLLVPLIIQYGLPLAESIFNKWSSGTVPTAADFDELRALAKQSAADRVTLQLAAAGVALDSPQALALLALAGGQPAVLPTARPA